VKTIAVIGWKNSGKTTLVSNLVKYFDSQNITVGVIKHAHHSFDIDHPNTDSYKIRKSGAYKTTLISENRLAYIEEKKDTEINLNDLISLNSGCDIIILEGFKKIDRLKKIEVRLKQNNKEPLYNTIKNVKLLITDDDQTHPIKTLNHNQIDLIAAEVLNEKF
tara:strand:- start:136 stop:624 length:489 start_codon:yes stop_codon:yes gene_type:complete